MNKALFLLGLVLAPSVTFALNCNDRNQVICETGENYERIQFLAPSLQGQFGYLDGSYRTVLAEPSLRANCFAVTANNSMNLLEGGEIDASISFKGSFTGKLNNISNPTTIPIFTFRVSYINPEGHTINKDYVMNVTYLGRLASLGTDEDGTPIYWSYRNNDFNYRIPEPINIPESASNIKASACVIHPNVSIDISKIVIATILN